MSRTDAFLRAQRLPDAYRDTIDRIWKPLAGRLAGVLRPALVGLSGPQGSGKSTGTAALKMLLEEQGLCVAVLSIDDFYYTRAQRADLAGRVHPLLATRGPPGTHDIALAEHMIQGLLAGESVALPSFDKGSDDRRPEGEWQRFEGPADLVILEGWCVGAVPQRAEALVEPINRLEREQDADAIWRRAVNVALATYQPLFARIAYLIQLVAPGFETVAGWRAEQEARAPKRGMTDAEVARFVQHYERITRWMLDEMPARADATVTLGPSREPLALTIP